ncbi:MAG: type II secretion system protein GspM [Burkholderiaceae bacterium]
MTLATLWTEFDDALRARLEPLARQARAAWQQRTRRERILLRTAALLLAALLLWTIALRPALHAVQAARQQLPVLQAQTARLGAVILEAEALARGRSGSIPAGDVEQALRSSLRAAGLEAVSDLSRPDGAAGGETLWQLSFVNAPAGRIMGWMANLPFLAQMQTRKVDLARSIVDGRDRPGLLGGAIILAPAPQRKAP